MSVPRIISLTPLGLLTFSGTHIRHEMNSSLSLFKQARSALFRKPSDKNGQMYGCCSHCFAYFEVVMKAVSQSDTRRLCPSEGQLSESVMASFGVRGVGFSQYFGISWKALKLVQKLVVKWDYKVGSVVQMISSAAGRQLPQWNVKTFLLWLVACDFLRNQFLKLLSLKL